MNNSPKNAIRRNLFLMAVALSNGFESKNYRAKNITPFKKFKIKKETKLSTEVIASKIRKKKSKKREKRKTKQKNRK